MQGQQAIFCVVPKGRCRGSCRTYNTEEEERAFLDLGTSIRGRFMKKRKKSFPLVLICCCSTLLFSSLDLYKSMFQMLLTAALHLIKEYTWKLDTTEEAEQLLLLVRRGVWTPSGTRTHFVILPCFSPLLVIPRNCPSGGQQADALPSFPFEKAMTINSTELIAKSQFKIPTPYTPDRTSLKVYNGEALAATASQPLLLLLYSVAEKQKLEMHWFFLLLLLRF